MARPIATRFSNSLLKELNRSAREENRTRSDQVRHAVSTYLGNRKMSSMKTGSPGGQRTGEATDACTGSKSGTRPDRSLNGHTNGPPDQPKERIFGQNPAPRPKS